MSSRQVTLDGGSPWGFRMHGGADAQLPLRIARVNPGSKAAVRGIREGDLISSINGRATGGLSNAEAHALLRSAQDTLTLGLNQGVTGSPKRRSQKLAQEIKEDNLKRTSVTSSSSSISNVSTIIHTISNSQQNNETAHTNGVGDHKTEETKSETLSNYTSYIRNGSPFTTPHGATNDTEKSRDACDDTVTQQHTALPPPASADCNESAAAAAGDDSVIAEGHDKALLAAVIMADNVSGSSRSRKRRSRSNRKKSKKPAVAAVTPADSVESVALEDSAPASYKVEFPTTTTTTATPMVEKKTNSMVKSRSLDDDDHVKITEVTEEEKTACLSESTAIVSEAESDVEWETVSELETQKENSSQQFGKLSVISLPLEEHVTCETSHISPEDERSLRDFLEGLNLVNSPEESAQRIEKTSGDSVKAKKAKKRAVLAQHFLPYYQNPRYLDVISEEGSDLSDRDSKQNTPFMCRVLDYNDDDEDDVFEDADIIKQQKLRNKFQTHFTGLNDGAILVGTKLIESNNVDTVVVKEATWTTSMAETQSGAEVVYLEDSSNSMTPSDLLDLEDTAGDLDADDEEDISLDLDRTCSESLDIDLNSSETCSLMKPDITITSSSDTASRASLPTDSDQTKSESVPVCTPPPTPDTLANDSAQMPPPPTTKKTIDFLQKLLFTLSNNNTNDILVTLNEQEAQHLPLHIKDKLKTFTESKDLANTNEIVGEINTLKNLISRENSEDRDLTCDNETKPERTVHINVINDSNERKSPQNSTREASIEKCSENEEELNKELKDLCERLQKPNEENSKRSGSASASVSRSDSASSARSSQCTALYNPLHSSLSNIAALLREGSCEGNCDATEPPPLREMCVRALLEMPFGKDVIEELANVSQSIEEMTCRTPSRTHTVPTPAPSASPHNSTDIDASSVLPVPVDSPVVQSAMDAERWVGMPSEENPNLLVCLSPAQREFIDKTKAIPNEADSLLDLHRKFIERRGYHEEYDLLTPKTTKDVPAFKIEYDNNSNKNNLLKIIQDSSNTNNNLIHNTSINYNDYVKQFTREIPIQMLKSNESEQRSSSGNIRYDTYIKQLVREVPIQVEKQINKPVNNKIYRDAPTEPRQVQEPRVHGDRLRARHLGEWLNLARNECNQINNLSEHANRVHNLQSSVNKLVSQRSCEERFSHVSNASFGRGTSPRRYSLPFNLYEQQMQYILEKEHEIQQEIEKLKEEKSKLEKDITPENTNDFIPTTVKEFDAGKYQISRKGDIAILHSETDKPLSTTPSTSEKFREQMYNEYMCKVAERQERKQNKVIKIKITTEEHHSEMSPQYEAKQVCGIEDEFMSKVRERKGKLGLVEEDSEQEKAKETKDTPPVKVLDGEALADAARLPKHLQEFIDIANSTPDDGVWTPGKGAEPEPAPRPPREPAATPTTPAAEQEGDEPAPVVWTPRSAGSSPTAERKEFRPVNFESPVLKRKNYTQQESSGAATPEGSASVPPPWDSAAGAEERRLTSSQSAPAAGLTSLGKLPRAQNPTITLLQKAREGQLPRGASYIEDHQAPTPKPRSKDSRPPIIGPNEILYTIKTEYISESDSEKPKKMADLGPRKFEGIGPTTKDGMPIVLRSEVKDSNQAKWYKRMYDTLHRSRNDDELVTVRYKTRRGRYPYTSAGGYLSEPEPNAYDSDVGVSASKYATLDRRRLQTGRDKENEYITYTVPRNKYMSASVRHSTDVYKNQPGRIENYVPGHSSISEKEAKEWWDEVMEIFDGHLEQQKHVPPSKSYMSHALKESGYESDSTLVFRRREDAALQLSPHEQKEAYKTIQKGGEVPLHGLRKLAPERPKESPRKYVEDEVTIHYRSPVRHEVKEALSEEELARRQAEAMRRIYQEERRRKYLQELQDMNSRRHTDNFIPSQKSPIPLNRYDDFGDDLGLKPRARSRSPEPRIVARALYNFVGQSARELTFRKGDVIYIRRQVDKNWFEGEHNAMLGLFPSNYVEIIPYDGIKSTPRKAHEGQARAKFNFIAQTHLELSLAKGELVVLTRRVDDNWFEGRIGSRKGIFPVSYVEILIDPGDKPDVSISSTKPVASPAAHSLLLNGSAGGKESMGSHHYQPSYTSQQTTTSYHAKPVNVIGTSTSYSSLTRTQKISSPSVNEALHIDTQSEPVPYRALYKYRPQNDDELELQEGDTVFVLEKCDDGWFVGSSQRTGAFGTFPGNYVERI